MDDWEPMGTTYQRFAERYVNLLERAQDCRGQDVGLAYGVMLAMKLATPKPQWDDWAVEHRGMLEKLGLGWTDIRAFMAHGKLSADLDVDKLTG